MTQIPARRFYDAFRRTPTFGSLDGLRCLSILAVIWHHAGTKGIAWRALDMGYLGVDLFFVISGFLIVTLLLRERAATNRISLRKFYIRRTLRIFPLYYGVILGLAAFYATVDPHSLFGKRLLAELPYYLTYTADFIPVGLGIVWSLAAEEQFYLLWPTIEKHLTKQVVPVLATLIILNQIVNFPYGKSEISRMVGSTSWSDLSISQATFTPILLGVWAAHLLHSERGYRLLGYLAAGRWASAVYLLTLVALLTMAPADISGLPRLAIQICMAALLVSCVYREDHILGPLLRLAPIQRIGKISYGMYLLHIQLIVLAAHLIRADPKQGSIELYALSLILTIIAAGLSFRFFEGPLLSLKRNYSVIHQAHV
jgi:peptidoglycan/LPS O-acetylase OafA/YrhL